MEELRTTRSVAEQVSELEGEGLLNEANWYAGRIQEMHCTNAGTFWDRLVACDPLELSETLFAAYRRA